MIVRQVAEKLHEITAFFLFDIEEETEETKVFSKRFNYLLDKYQLEKADDPDIYEGDLSEWEEEKLLTLEKELGLLITKYHNLLGTASPLVNDNEEGESKEENEEEEDSNE